MQARVSTPPAMGHCYLFSGKFLRKLRWFMSGKLRRELGFNRQSNHCVAFRNGQELANNLYGESLNYLAAGSVGDSWP